MRRPLHRDASRSYDDRVRTTVTLDDDVVAVIERVRASTGVGLSEAVNTLVRRAVAHRSPSEPFRLRSASLGQRVDLGDVVAVLDLLDDGRP
jgi:Arc/MetJ family transcription regulator